MEATKYRGLVDRVASLGATTVISGHGSTLHGGRLAAGYELLRQLPQMDEAVEFGQADLEAMLAAAMEAAA